MHESKWLAGLGGALSLLMLPALAHASCGERKLTGTVIGGVGGAVIGNSISHGGGGAVIGGLGGAVLGHEIAGSGCGRYRRTADYQRRGYYPRAVHPVYYDQHGEATYGSGAPYASHVAYGYARPTACRTEMQNYYDERGALIERPVQVCGQ